MHAGEWHRRQVSVDFDLPYQPLQYNLLLLQQDDLRLQYDGPLVVGAIAGVGVRLGLTVALDGVPVGDPGDVEEVVA